MLQKLLKHSFLFLAAALLLGSCECCDDPSDPSCRNYDPCLGSEISAAYHTHHWWVGFGAGHFTPPTDTIRTPGVILFTLAKPDPDADSIRWKVGHEASYRYGDSLRVAFPTAYNETIPIEVTVFKKKAQDCGHSETGYVTTTGSIPLVDYDHIMGSEPKFFKGTSSQYGETDTIIVEIGSGIWQPWHPNRFIYGVPTYCRRDSLANKSPLLIMPGYRQFAFIGETQGNLRCNNVQGYGHIRDEAGGTMIYLDYTVREGSGSTASVEQFTFTGKKLPE